MIVEPQSDSIHSKALPDLIAKLLSERQEMLVLFNQLVALKPYTDVDKVQPVLQQFCQVVVDYMALGHFEVYQCIEEGSGDTTQHCHRIKQVASELYPCIAETTQTAIDFNDRYDCADHCEILDTLCRDLSHLGEALASRIELEDRLIAVIRVT